jgi:hypothetical protein
VVISINGDMKSSKGEGVETNIDEGALLPIVIEKDLSTDADFDADTEHDLSDNINTALQLLELLKERGVL